MFIATQGQSSSDNKFKNKTLKLVINFIYFLAANHKKEENISTTFFIFSVNIFFIEF